MGRELTHEESTDLLGAYALDALEPSEHQLVDRHLQTCAACRSEVAEHREVAGLLTPGWGKPPAGVWDRIAAALEEDAPPLDMAPVIALKPRAAPETVAAPPATSPRRSLGVGIAAMVAVAAVAVIGFLGVRVAEDRRRIDELANPVHVTQLQRSVDAAMADPGARRVELASTDGRRNAEAVLLPDGTGYLVRNNLPALAGERTYQLWAVTGSTTVSVGVLGSEPKIVPFKMDGFVSALAITEEAAGGVVSSRNTPVVVGRLQNA